MFIADLESEPIFEVAGALRVPVLVLTVLALGFVLIELGGFAVELMRRRRRDLARLRSVTERPRLLVRAGDRGPPARPPEDTHRASTVCPRGDQTRRSPI